MKYRCEKDVYENPDGTSSIRHICFEFDTETLAWTVLDIYLHNTEDEADSFFREVWGDDLVPPEMSEKIEFERER
jgi:hypothetical protein